MDISAKMNEMLILLNHVASSYPDESYTGGALRLDERRRILDFTFAHWKEHAPLLKGLLALRQRMCGSR